MAYNLKTRIWQTGALEWWGRLDGEEIYLGSREFPLPPEEGDRWVVRATGETFCIMNGTIRRISDLARAEEEQ
ncbi:MULTISPECIES: hypothetical protein [Syntrophotalea]|jgi:hypothetical protein|uniref:DUF5348 domain-containing protein n=1 Tax=Syntrophotalea acetylenica TaxID=29542 RepID=A0A1L3GFD9_SYNAC|nr:hypothetical protein [Syntrophotalea acetylenica]APG24663.1 hypothetical protein A7E75_06200 [Syntrophotalea acetylenica]APG42711.1 hypothetical protein A6070_00120 [Syntrophotalea acetylenica]